MTIIDLFAQLVPLSVLIVFGIIWMLYGRAVFLYHLPPETKWNRRLAMLTGPMFFIVINRFPHWLTKE